MDGHRSGAFRLVGDRVEQLGPRHRLPRMGFQKVTLGPNGAVVFVGPGHFFVSTSDEGEGDPRFRRFQAPSGVPGGGGAPEVAAGLINDVLPLEDGKFVLTSTLGLFHFDGQNWRREVGQGLKASREVGELLKTRDGRIWFAHRGISSLAWNRPSVSLGVKDGLSDDKVLCLFEDREGSLWVGTRAGGVVQVSQPRIWNLNAKEGLAGSTSFGVLGAKDGSVWITSSEGVNRFQNGRIQSYRAGPAFPFFKLRGLAEAPDGAVWIGAARDGLLRWKDEEFSWVRLRRASKAGGDGDEATAKASGNALDKEVSLLVAGEDGALWVAWRGGGSAVSTSPRLRPLLSSFRKRDAQRCHGPHGRGLSPGLNLRWSKGVIGALQRGLVRGRSRLRAHM